MIPVLETDWTIFFLAAGGFVTTVGTAAVGIIVAIGSVNKKMDAAAERREQIAGAVLNPETAVQTAPPVSPPKS